MAVQRYITATDIVNRAAVECGLSPVSDPYSSIDTNFVQLRYLLDTCGQDLVEMYPWETLRREEAILTTGADSGKYPLPNDFGYMLDQTGWERRENVPLGGPLSPQQWAYLIGRDLVSYTIYASFRITENEFWLFPGADGGVVPDGLDIHYEYISRNWSVDQTDQTAYSDTIQKGSDQVLFKPTMIAKMLRAKFKSAKGFASANDEAEFMIAYNAATGNNKGAPILSVGGRSSGIHYLDFTNIPNTQFGGP